MKALILVTQTYEMKGAREIDFCKLDEILRDIEKAKTMAMNIYQSSAGQEFYRQLFSLSLFLEKLTDKTRRATIQETENSKQSYLKAAATTMGITVRFENNHIVIHLPYLLPKSKSVNSDSYITEPLAYALQEFVDQNKPEKFRNALMIIRSVYCPEDARRMKRDNDNIETRHVINIISTMLLVDDNMLDILLCSRIGGTTHTEIIVINDQEKATY